MENEYKEMIDRESEYWGREIADAYNRGVFTRIDFRKLCTTDEYSNCYYNNNFDEIFDKEPFVFFVKNTEPKDQVLVLGCGGGGTSLELARLNRNVEGVDISVKCIEICEKVKHEDRSAICNLKYSVGDLNKICLKADNYDAIITEGSLHHILEMDYLMSEIKKALKPEGKLLIYDNIGETIVSRCLLKPLACLRKTITGDTKVLPPFEGVGSQSIVSSVKRHFRIERLEYVHYFSKTIGIIIFNPRVWKIWKRHKHVVNVIVSILLILRRIDRLICKAFKLHGENVFILAKKYA